MLKFIMLFLLLLPQSYGKKSAPLKIPLSLSGSYGELRSGRFHAGLDFRVGGVVGEKIYAFDDGYISRVVVSPDGYGNGVYIKHPDGTTSIYGHLLDFSPELNKRVKQEQYSLKSFSVDISFRPEEFPISAGEFIGRAGNSGSSAAPHLHFELRNSENTAPLNIIKHGYLDLNDKTPPIFQGVNFYSYSESCGVPVINLLHNCNTATSSVLKLGESSFVGIDAVDKQAGTVAKLAVERYRVLLDTTLIFDFSIDDYTYEEQSYFNSLIVYSEKVNSGRNMIKTLKEPGNRFADRIRYKDNGLILLNDDDVHTVKIEIYDVSGNRAIRTFKVQRGEVTAEVAMTDSSSVAPSGEIFVPWFSPFVFFEKGITLTLPAASLYSSTNFTASVVTPSEGVLPKIYSAVWRLHTPTIPLHRSAKLSLTASVPDSLRSKALIVSLSPSGGFSSRGGTWENGAVTTTIRSFGTYCVTIDSTAPTIVPRFKNGADISRSGQLVFTIKDELSGIADYSAEVDGEWILARYDQKFDKLWVEMDPTIVKRGKKHEIIVRVTDIKNNIKEVKYNFIW